MMLLAEWRKCHFPPAVFHSSHYTIMEEDVSIYTVPPAPNRNVWEGRFLCGFDLVAAIHFPICISSNLSLLQFFSMIFPSLKTPPRELLTIPLLVRWQQLKVISKKKKKTLNKTKILKPIPSQIPHVQVTKKNLDRFLVSQNLRLFSGRQTASKQLTYFYIQMFYRTMQVKCEKGDLQYLCWGIVIQKELEKLILSMQNLNSSKLARRNELRCKRRKSKCCFPKKEKMFSMLSLAVFKDL